jgi:hypothetical protein
MAGFTPMDAGYVMVADRHAQFVIDHPNGIINTELAFATSADGVGLVVVKASVWKERANMEARHNPDGTGLASMPIPGVTSFTRNSEVENAETSALGRALAMIGYHPKSTMASEDEIHMKKGDTAATDTFAPRVAAAKKMWPESSKAEVSDDSLIDSTERAKIMSWGKKVLETDRAGVLEFLKENFGITSGKDITVAQAKDIKKMFAIMRAAGAKEVAAPDGVTFDTE